MEPEDFHHLSTSTSASSSPQRRIICPNCSRPNRVCLCHSLPAQRIPTTTQIIILQHPHEAKHKLSTTPILTKCLVNATTIITRRLRSGLSPLLDQSSPAIYLFPPTHSSPAVNLTDLNPSSLLHTKGKNLVLIVFDGTWKHANEMVRASEEFLSKFAIRVCLDFDVNVEGGSMYDSELILRKEPFGGCVSTMEAVARCLRVIEPDGVEIESKLIRVLRDVVRLQARHLKPMMPRPKLVKKNVKEKEQRDENENSNLLG